MAYYTVTAHEMDPATPGVYSRTLTGTPSISTAYVLRYIIKVYSDAGVVIEASAMPTVSISGSSSPANLKLGKVVRSGGAITNPNTNYYVDVRGSGQSTIVPVFTVEAFGNPISVKGSIAQPIFTKASATPAIPTGSQIQQDIAKTNGLSTSSDVVYNPCPGQPDKVWAALIITLGQTSLQGGIYKYQINYYKKDGSAGAPPEVIKGTQSSVILRDNTTGSEYRLAAAILVNIKTGANCAASNVLTTGVNPPGSNPLLVAGDSRFNPPNHILTRSDPFGQRILTGKSSKLGSGTLGYIYQDASTAAALNTSAKPGTKAKVTKATDLWGFRFIYNPTTITYTTQSSSALDFTTFAADPANLVGGNTVISFDIYLNRIADMSTLDPRSPDYANWKSFYPDMTRGDLTPEKRDFILKRGTEYDLEYLYRVVNGDPRANDVLTINDPSSDFGYITGAPFWLRIHDNLRYFCAISSLSVNHVMFTADMVPMLTVVSLYLVRYPGVNSTTEKSVNKTLTTPTTAGK